MKKILSILLALLMLCSVFLTACDLEKEASSTTSSTQSSGSSSNGGSNNGGGNGDGGDKDPEIPSKPPVGYTFFTMNDLRFAYPQTWTVGSDDDGETEISDEAGNNISMAYDQDAMIFQNITADEYWTLLAPMLEAEGITVSNVTAQKRENSLGLEINVIIADLSYQGISMKQVTYATTLNNNAYAIILTLLEENAELEEKVFDSMVNLNPSEDETPVTPDPNAPAGYKTFTNYNLRFAYPEDWTTSAVANTRGATFEGGLYMLNLSSGPLTPMFSSLTTESFRENMVPYLEMELEGTIADEYVEQVRNENGLTVTLVSFSITDEDMTGWQIWYCVDIDQSTHCLMLTAVVENEELFMEILDSITAVDGPNVSNGSESESTPGTSTKPGDDSSQTKPNPGTSATPDETDPNPGTSTNPSNKEQEIYQEAKSFYKKGDYEKAYVLFSQIPDYPGVDKYLDELEELLNSNDSSMSSEK